jgi:hypothetical protein
MKLTLKGILESDDSSSRGHILTKRESIITITGFQDKITPERVQKYLKPQGVETDIKDNILTVKTVMKMKKPVTSPDEKVNKIKLILQNAGWDMLKVNIEVKTTGDILNPTFENKTKKTITKTSRISLSSLKECGCETNNQTKPQTYRPDYPDPEGEMAKQQLYKVAKYAAELYAMLDDNDELDSWVQDKLSKISDNISSIKHYLEYEMKQSSMDNKVNMSALAEVIAKKLKESAGGTLDFASGKIEKPTPKEGEVYLKDLKPGNKFSIGKLEYIVVNSEKGNRGVGVKYADGTGNMNFRGDAVVKKIQ